MNLFYEISNDCSLQRIEVWALIRGGRLFDNLDHLATKFPSRLTEELSCQYWQESSKVGRLVKFVASMATKFLKGATGEVLCQLSRIQ